MEQAGSVLAAAPVACAQDAAGPSTSASARRQKVRLSKWRDERTLAPPSDVRLRERLLPDGADHRAILQHNAWDDVEWDPSEVEAAEQMIARQPIAEPSASDAYRVGAAAAWDGHYASNLRNYRDRRYLHNEFPHFLSLEAQAQLAAAHGARELVIFETGCGVGNTMLPMLAANPDCRVIGCDISATAIRFLRERLEREGLAGRGQAFVADLGLKLPPEETPHLPFAHLVLAIFTLSALPPDRLSAAFRSLYASLLPNGRLLLRDYGRLDLKQLKFSKAKAGRLEAAEGHEWYARGDGTSVCFFTLEYVEALAQSCEFEVESLGYDHRLVVNRANQQRMHRVWIVAVLRKPASTISSSAKAPPAALQGDISEPASNQSAARDMDRRIQRDQ